MRGTFLTLISFGLCFATKAQNLVPNPSMENNVACPTNVNYYVDRAVSWSDLSGHGGSSDYFHSCGDPQHDWTNFTDNGAVTPNSGNAYIGSGTYDDLSQREYAMAQLTAPLTAGDTYFVSAYIYGARGDFASNVYTNNVGVYVGTNPSVSGCGMCVNVYNVTPQAISGVTSNSWTQISGTFVASGGENYVVLGNFNSNASTTVVSNGAAAMGGNSAYTYYDDVEVSPINPLPITFGDITIECGISSGAIKWVNYSENNVCSYTVEALNDSKWISLGEITAQGANGQAANYQVPVDNELYKYFRLKVNDCDGRISFSNVFSTNCSDQQIEITSVTGDDFIYGHVSGMNPSSAYRIECYSVTGQLVSSEEILGQSSFMIDKLASGSYLIKVVNAINQEQLTAEPIVIAR